MECRAYCTSVSYPIKLLIELFKKAGNEAILYRDVIYIKAGQGSAFFFPYGAIVFWGLSHEQCLPYFEQLKNFTIPFEEEMELDLFNYTFDEVPRIVEDEIYLPNDEILNFLAISHGLAQSVKLGTFETAIHKTFAYTKHLPEDLAKHGRIPLSRKEIRRKMGELFIKRNSINLHVDVLDTPEFFWEHPELEPLYAMTSNYLDVDSRVEVLNQRLDVMHELFEMLGNELNHQHSSRLEWTIIALIVVEVMLTLFKDVFHVL